MKARDVARGVVWCVVTLDIMGGAIAMIVRLTTDDVALRAELRADSDHMLLGAVFGMVFFLCVPQSPGYITPSDAEREALS